jgi:hypothetical protein
MRLVWAVFVAGVALAPACEGDPMQESAPTLADCPPGQRRVVFRLDGGLDVTRCVQFDTLVASPSPSCAVVVWTAPHNRRHDEGFRFEANAADSAEPCGRAYFFAVVQNSVGGYTYFDGLVRRNFDDGDGPFATGVYEIINYQQTLVGIGNFEFWE